MTRHGGTERRCRPVLRHALGIGALLAALSGCATSAPEGDMSLVAIDGDAALLAVNAFRAEHGAARLTIDNRLMTAAARQSKAMAARGKMDHALAGRLPGRLEAAGYAWSIAAENIARSYPDHAAALAGWIASTGHRRNLLDARVTQIGFAGTRDPSGRTYWTQIFAAPK